VLAERPNRAPYLFSLDSQSRHAGPLRTLRVRSRFIDRDRLHHHPHTVQFNEAAAMRAGKG